jgi:hypothetical protein
MIWPSHLDDACFVFDVLCVEGLDGGVGLYLATVLDLHACAVVGWSMGSHMRTSWALTPSHRGNAPQRERGGACFAVN